MALHHYSRRPCCHDTIQKLVPIRALTLHRDKDGSGLYLPGIVGQAGNRHALVSDPFQHSKAALNRADQFIERHIRIPSRPWPA
jgi:hypothetical protein